MIKVENFYMGYGRENVLQDISFEVKKGSVHGLIGVNGSGKTTMIKCLTGIYKPKKGTILVDGEAVYDNPEVKEKMGYVADQNEYYPNYRVSEMIRIYSALYPNFSKDDFNDYNEAMGLKPRKMIKQLSKGQKMRLALILNLAAHPEILVLDEPMEGIDVIAKKQLMEMIIREVEEREMTVLITSHHMEELENFCDAITVIGDGKVISDGSLDDVKDEIKKIQVVFPKGLPKRFDQWEHVLHFSNIGSIYTVVTDLYDEEMQQRLQENGAEFMEEIPITLEEYFLYMNKKKGGAQ